jgi:hypothetical protein
LIYLLVQWDATIKPARKRRAGQIMSSQAYAASGGLVDCFALLRFVLRAFSVECHPVESPAAVVFLLCMYRRKNGGGPGLFSINVVYLTPVVLIGV